MIVQPGDQIELVYPTHTHVRRIHCCRAVPRNLTVRSIRDLVEEPLTPEEFLRRPYVARSRWLLQAFDNDRQKFRQFYLGSSVNFHSPGTLRLATYRPGESKPHRILTGGYEPTVRDRRELVRSLQRLAVERERHPMPTLEQIRIMADDLRRVS